VYCETCGETIYKYPVGIQPSEQYRLSTDLKFGKCILKKKWEKDEGDYLLIKKEHYKQYRNTYWVKIVPKVLFYKKRLREIKCLDGLEVKIVNGKKIEYIVPLSEYDIQLKKIYNELDAGVYFLADKIFNHCEFHFVKNDDDKVIFFSEWG